MTASHYPGPPAPRLLQLEQSRAPRLLRYEQWQGRQAAHQRLVDGWTAGYRARRLLAASQAGRDAHSGHGGHPVEDFLFTYYSHRPARLRRWHPGPGVLLAGADPAEFGADYQAVDGGVHDNGGVQLNTARVLARRGEQIARIGAVLRGTASRPAQFGCFGMHEWAMVYRQSAEQVRHTGWPLRLTPAHTAEVLEQNRVRCSHFDAYRFFTGPAMPRNELRPTRANQPELEQPGCLHANMDLYRYAYKLSPLIPAELVTDCFALAREIRELDMRASPYDLAELGYPPVPVETPEGRAEYAAAQRDFAQRAAPLRDSLLAALDALATFDAPAALAATPSPQPAG